jgi:hypothetical protein
MSRYDTNDKFMIGEVIAYPNIKTGEPVGIATVIASDYGRTIIQYDDESRGHGTQPVDTSNFKRWNNEWAEEIPDHPLIKQAIESKLELLRLAKIRKGKRSPYRMMDGERYEDRKKKPAKPAKRKPVKKCKCK